MANDTESVTAMRIKELSGTVTMLALFTGERAGVRASVNYIPLKSARKWFLCSFTRLTASGGGRNDRDNSSTGNR